jgi:phosphoribosylaminoimidazolecarboxamide formyltransferase/IMP cyclohydrolase
MRRALDKEIAEELHATFVEVVIAPGYDDEALAIPQQKELIRILDEERPRRRDPAEHDFKKVLGGVLIQELDDRPDPRQGLDG